MFLRSIRMTAQAPVLRLFTRAGSWHCAKTFLVYKTGANVTVPLYTCTSNPN